MLNKIWNRIRYGAVAQLGERFGGIEEAGGSSPPSSTTFEDNLEDLQGACQQAGAEAFWRVDDELEHKCWATVAAERMAKAIHGLVFHRKIDSRSEAADAALDWRNPVTSDSEGPKVSDETTEEEHWNEDGPTGLAVELADMVSDMIWGGERGWERADKEQFKHLKREARKRMKAGSERLAEAENENRYRFCSGCGDSHKGRRCYD